MRLNHVRQKLCELIGQADKYVKKNKIKKGQIWCVYDKDSFPPEHFNGVVERAESLNKENRNYSTIPHGVMSVLSSGFCFTSHIITLITIEQSILHF